MIMCRKKCSLETVSADVFVEEESKKYCNKIFFFFVGKKSG